MKISKWSQRTPQKGDAINHANGIDIAETLLLSMHKMMRWCYILTHLLTPVRKRMNSGYTYSHVLRRVEICAWIDTHIYLQGSMHSLSNKHIHSVATLLCAPTLWLHSLAFYQVHQPYTERTPFKATVG